MVHRDMSDYLVLKAFKWYNAAYADLDGSNNADHVSTVTEQYPEIWAEYWLDRYASDRQEILS